MTVNKDKLRENIIKALKLQGFSLNPHLKPENNKKDTLRNIHQQKRREQLRIHRKFLVENSEKVKEYSLSGREMEPKKIDLELIEVHTDSFYSRLFFSCASLYSKFLYHRPLNRAFQRAYCRRVLERNVDSLDC